MVVIRNGIIVVLSLRLWTPSCRSGTREKDTDSERTIRTTATSYRLGKVRVPISFPSLQLHRSTIYTRPYLLQGHNCTFNCSNPKEYSCSPGVFWSFQIATSPGQRRPRAASWSPRVGTGKHDWDKGISTPPLNKPITSLRRERRNVDHLRNKKLTSHKHKMSKTFASSQALASFQPSVARALSILANVPSLLDWLGDSQGFLTNQQVSFRPQGGCEKIGRRPTII